MDTDAWITSVLALRRAKQVVVFTGAGISAESGVPTFRDAGGFWQRYPPETFATWKGLLRTAVTSPRVVADFVLNVIEPIALAAPNAAHRAVADIERHASTAVVTQNIDGLHQAAGSTKVFEIHGSMLEVVDTSIREVIHHFSHDDLGRIAAALRKFATRQSSLFRLLRELRRLYPLDWRGRHRPNLVLFGDAMAEPAWSDACQLVEACDVLLSVGTSGAVLPAAMLPGMAESAGATVISVDPEPGAGCWLEGEAGTILPKLVDDAFGTKQQ